MSASKSNLVEVGGEPSARRSLASRSRASPSYMRSQARTCLARRPPRCTSAAPASWLPPPSRPKSTSTIGGRCGRPRGRLAKMVVDAVHVATSANLGAPTVADAQVGVNCCSRQRKHRDRF